MPDFERIDRELAALGTVPSAVQPLLDQYGQRDRSLETVDVVLEALKDGREPTSSPPESLIERPSFLPLGWDADRKSEPGGIEAVALPSVAEREEITVTTGAPDEMEPVESAAAVASPFEPEPEPQPEQAEPEPASAPEALSASSPDQDTAQQEPVDTQEASPPPPPEEPEAPSPFAPAEDLSERPARRSSRPPRADLQALLDAELDPREFPSTNPPPARFSRSSLPAPSMPPPLPSIAPAAQDTDFELLVDDDDILEIDEENP